MRKRKVCNFLLLLVLFGYRGRADGVDGVKRGEHALASCGRRDTIEQESVHDLSIGGSKIGLKT